MFIWSYMFIEFHKLFSPTQLIGATCLFSTLEYQCDETLKGGDDTMVQQ